MSEHDAYGPSHAGTGPLPTAALPPDGPHIPPQGWQQPGHDQLGYPAAGGPPPGYGYGYDVGPQRTNVMAILGLVFAFVFSPLGIVFSAIGLSQVKRRGEKGRGLAVSGLILSIVFLVIGVLFSVFVLAAASKAVTTADAELSASASAASADASQAASSAEAAAPKAGGGAGITTACQTIVPALMKLEADMQDVHTSAQYSQALAKLEATLSTAAGGANDAAFQSQIAALNTDLENASAAVQQGKDPSSLISALDQDGSAVGDSCAQAGVTG